MKALFSCLILILTCSTVVRAQEEEPEPEEESRPGPPSQSLFFGSVAQGTATGAVIPLSVGEAIDRALKYNLATLVTEQESRFVAGARLKALSDLMPKVNATVSEISEQINLAAFGFTGFPGVRQIVGPFSVFDARARVNFPLVDVKLRHDLKSSDENINASRFSQQDVREIVVLVTTDLYLQSVAAGSRVDAARAQLRTAQAVLDQATNLRQSGVAPGIDVIRAQVQLQAQQQRVLAAENDLAKSKLNLARAIGLPQAQQFNPTDSFVTNAGIGAADFNQLLTSALDARPDYLRAAALVRSAEEARKSAISRGKPSVRLNADYGDIGRTPGRSHGTVTAQATLLVPIYTGRRVQAELEKSEALLEQRKAEAANLRDRIEYEIRTANLDIQSALERVKVAQSTQDLAQQQLTQSQDRFAAGVATSLEVVQSQDAIVTANETYISSLYTLNVAQASLARATGAAEKTIKTFFGGK